MPHVEIIESNQTPALVRDAYFQAAKRQMELAMLDAQGAIVSEMPSRTGTARRSVVHLVEVVGNTIHGAVGTALRYVDYINRGTGLYGPNHTPIVPVKARALRFPTPGNTSFTLAGRQRSGKAGAGASWVVVRSVKGVKAMHFFEKGFALSQAVWTRKLQEVPQVAQRLIAQRTRTQTKRIGDK